MSNIGNSHIWNMIDNMRAVLCEIFFFWIRLCFVTDLYPSCAADTGLNPMENTYKIKPR
jgi:hypothetical protein